LAYVGSPELARDKEMVKSNEWKCGRNVGICAGVRCFKFWLLTMLTLVMLFRGLSLNKCIVGLELRLYSHPNEGKDYRFFILSTEEYKTVQ